MLSPGQDPLGYPNYFKELQYPLVWSPKFDGIRGVPKKGTVLSRTGKPLPSYQVQDEFSMYEDWDFEIIEGNVTDFGVYNRTQSHVMSENKPGDLHIFVFDICTPLMIDMRTPYYQRLDELKNQAAKLNLPDNVHIVEHPEIETEEELLSAEANVLGQGYEGLMWRSPVGHYKCNRATWKEGIIGKLKRFEDVEGTLVDIHEGETNLNPQERDELGFAKRSDRKDGKIGSGMAGTYFVEFEGQIVDVAPGSFTHDERKEHLLSRARRLGSYLKFRIFRHGVKDKPRFGRALGWRDPMDL